MFFIESNLRKWLKYAFMMLIIFFSILLIIEVYNKYRTYHSFQLQQQYYETQYNSYIQRVDQQRKEIKEFFEFLIDNNLYLIEFDYSYSSGIKAKVSTFLDPTEKIVSKYEILEISKFKMNEEYYVILQINQ
ncbi:MAG TPA: hypothetical protein PK894_02705 [Defluviitoga sp.]|nr:hypothetical protein [Defluviitoga sp.]HOP23856.1 hypothetical protein [Defluviitoga sp.]HPZ28397.1 hypothetical protein [Defluviitoga sp.]HQD62495.1 hypothetical protein [Defluviitoga sp.]